MEQQHLSSADLLTLQVLERELIDPAITKAYERELRARVEYLNASPTEKSERRRRHSIDRLGYGVYQLEGEIIIDPLEEYYKK